MTGALTDVPLLIDMLADTTLDLVCVIVPKEAQKVGNALKTISEMQQKRLPWVKPQRLGLDTTKLFEKKTVHRLSKYMYLVQHNVKVLALHLSTYCVDKQVGEQGPSSRRTRNLVKVAASNSSNARNCLDPPLEFIAEFCHCTVDMSTGFQKQPQLNLGFVYIDVKGKDTVTVPSYVMANITDMSERFHVDAMGGYFGGADKEQLSEMGERLHCINDMPCVDHWITDIDPTRRPGPVCKIPRELGRKYCIWMPVLFFVRGHFKRYINSGVRVAASLSSWSRCGRDEVSPMDVEIGQDLLGRFRPRSELPRWDMKSAGDADLADFGRLKTPLVSWKDWAPNIFQAVLFYGTSIPSKSSQERKAEQSRNRAAAKGYAKGAKGKGKGRKGKGKGKAKGSKGKAKGSKGKERAKGRK